MYNINFIHFVGLILLVLYIIYITVKGENSKPSRVQLMLLLVYRTSLQNIGSLAHIQGDKIYLCCFLPWDLYDEFLDLCEAKSLTKIRRNMRHEKPKSMNTWRLGPWVLRGNCGMKPGWEMHKRWDQLFKIRRSQWGDGNGATGSLMGLFWGII